MAFGRKMVEEVEQKETKVWECSSDSCNGWVRDNFRDDDQEVVTCPLCKSEMKEGIRVIPVIVNHKPQKK